MSEASPRPWRVSECDPALVLDADGFIVGLWSNEGKGRANAALIVAVVNAQWEREAPLRAWNQPVGGGSATTSSGVRNDSLCDRPLEHAAGCECGQL